MDNNNFTHDNFFKTLLDNKDYRYDLLNTVLPLEIKSLIDLKKLKRINTSFINPELKSTFADHIFETPLKNKDKGFVCLLFEHKSHPFIYTAIQLLFYIASGYYQQVFKNKEKPKLIIPIIYYQGKKKWKYLAMEDLFKELPLALKPFVPIFKTIFIDLKDYSDKEIDSWTSEVLSVSTLIQKHAFDKEFLEEKINEICTKIDNLDDRNLILSIFVYYMNQSEIKEEKIIKIVKELKNKKDIMSTLQLIEKRGEKRGEKIGEAIGEAKTNEKIVLNCLSKGYELKMIADVTGLTLRKIKDIIKKNGLVA